MPTLETGSRDRASEAGFSLVELLAVLAILSLMIGAVVLNLPEPRSEADRRSEAITAQAARFLDDGAAAGEMHALGVDAEALHLFRHDGLVWQEAAALDWPDGVRIVMYRDEDRTDLPDIAEPALLFEPYGAVPDFAVELQSREATYRLMADDRGRLVREVSR